MNNSGDAAEQVVRMYLEGIEVVAKLTGAGAKNVYAILVSTLSQQNKTKGKSRLASMIKSGKPLKVFSISKKDLSTFTSEAKRYGILYNVLKSRTDNSPDAPIDIIVREEDGAKIQRIVDRFKLATVDQAAIISDSQRDVADRKAVEREASEKSRGQRIYEETIGVQPQKEKNAPENPTAAKTEKSPPSRHFSEDNPTSTKRVRTTSTGNKKPSVKEKLERYQEQSRQIKGDSRSVPKQTQQDFSPTPNGQTIHRQPKQSKKHNER